MQHCCIKYIVQQLLIYILLNFLFKLFLIRLSRLYNYLESVDDWEDLKDFAYLKIPASASVRRLEDGEQHIQQPTINIYHDDANIR